MKINDYYSKVYLPLHQNLSCRRLHVAGQFTTIFFILFSIMTNIWFLLLAPFIVYPFAWSGHVFFEKNKPLSWKGKEDYGMTTIRSKICDMMMFRDWLLGRIER